MPDQLLTVKQVAERLQVAISTVFAIVDQGLLPATNITPGRKRRTLRFKPDSVDAFVNQQQVASEAIVPMRRRPEKLVTVGFERMRKRGFKG